MSKFSKNFKNGGISIFIVTITCILVAIITAGFIRLMIRDQQQASKNDLSQSAYDSAQAGVEDAKRFISIYQQQCKGGLETAKKVVDGKTIDCKAMSDSINSQNCYTLATAGIGSSNNETVIQTSTSTNDKDLNQAYTCVKISTRGENFLGSISEGSASTIRLKGVSNFNQVKISWYSKDDLSSSSNSQINLDNLTNPSSRPNTDTGKWKSQNKPALMKAQFYGFKTGVSGVLNGLDTSYSDDKTGSDEMLFYPAIGSRSSNNSSLPTDRRTDGSTAKTTDFNFTKCKNSLTASDLYACGMTINIGNNIQPSDILYLRLSALFNSSNFKVELLNNGSIVEFDGVQPKVDSTGRANQQYRRIESRIEFSDMAFPVPNFAAETENDSAALCKNFWVTKKYSGQESDGSGVKCESI